MTVNSTTNRVSYAGNGTANPLAVAFPFLAAADLKVLATVVATGVQTLLTLNSNYTVSGTPDVNGYYTNGGNVVPSSSIPVGTNWTIYRDPALTQLVQHVDDDPLPAESIDTPLDRLTMIAQRLSDRLNRALSGPDGEPLLNWTVPSIPDRAGKMIGFDITTGAPSVEVPDVEAYQAAAEAAAQLLADAEAAIAELGTAAVGFSAPTNAYLNAPTGSEPVGYRALVGKAPTGAFAGMMGQIAQKGSSVWLFSGAPKAGQRVWDKATNLWWVSQNGWWNKLLSNLPGAVAQDFADVPDNTAADGLILATGQAMSCQGSGSGTTKINNGRIEPTNNVYNVVAVPYKNMSLWMEGAWRAGHSGSGSLTISAGQLNAGAIITGHMVHTQHLYQARPTLELWNGPETTSPLNYLFNDDITRSEETDANYALIAAGNKVEISVKIANCEVICATNMQRFTTHYYNDMVSSMVGDIAANDSNGYVYFQSGGVADPDANNPYIYRFIAEPLPATFYTQNPRYAPSSDAVPVVKSADLAFGSATEVFRYTPGDGVAAAMFEADVSVISTGAVAGYAGVLQKWRFGGGKFSGTITASNPVEEGSDYPLSLNGAVITLSGVLTQAISGSDIVIKYQPQRSGSDATTYNPTVKVVLRQLAHLVTVT